MPDDATSEPSQLPHDTETIRWSRPGRVIEMPPPPEMRRRDLAPARAKFTRAMRYLHLVLVGLLLAGVLLQAYTAGRYIFGSAADNSAHELGWPIAHMLAPLMMIASFFTRGGKPIIVGSVVAFMVAAAMPFVALANEKGPSDIEALHPVMAVLLFSLLVWLFARARAGVKAMPTPRTP